MRLVVASNRLPVTITREDGTYRTKESVGGLVSGLNPFLEAQGAERLWIGWPGIPAPKQDHPALRERLRKEHGALPVFLREATVKNHYRGFCNRTLWPLFHYFTTYVEYEDRYWESYQHVNERFADAIAGTVAPGDTIWVHDYHLMLLPQLLRERLPDAAIGYFHHIPFPSFEVYRLLPRAWGQALLRGLMGADLVAFHTYDYTQYFLRSLLRLLGLENVRGELTVDGRPVKVDTVPMGVDFPKFAEVDADPAVDAEQERYAAILRDQKVVLSIDRLDYSKGIENRLEGFQTFLERNPEWHKRVTLVLVVVPSRTRVVEYRRMKRQIDQLVGEINGAFGDITWTPILYQFAQIPFEALAALYGLADVALVTPLRDGMNLIAMEYLATTGEGPGVLVLSEMAGAARELPEALIVNPSDRGEIADALREGLEMDPEEQMERNRAMVRRLERRDALWWGRTFVRELERVKEAQAALRTKRFGSEARARFEADFRGSTSRLLLLNYDGTLVPFVRHPEQAEPDDGLRELLEGLHRLPNTDVVVVSGRPRPVLEEWLQGLDVGLIAEHGAWIRKTGGSWETVGPLRDDWKDALLPLFQGYADRVPRSAVEVKDYSLVWHYGDAEPELGSSRAAELADELSESTEDDPLLVLRGGKVVEVRNAGVTKGNGALQWVMEGSYDFVAAFGDDWTDEGLFLALPDDAWTVRVGAADTEARWIVDDYGAVRDLLGRLPRADPPG